MQNPDKNYKEFPFSAKKMSVSGCLFDYDKLNDVSKNVMSKMSAEDVTEKVLEWASAYDKPFAELIRSDKEYATKIFSIGRGGKKPRKDLSTLKDAKGYMGFFYDELFVVEDEYPESFDKADIKATLERFAESFDITDDMNTWFEKVKTIADSLGYASDMKEYKSNPDAFRGNVADISMFIRVAVTGKQNAPDLYTVMQIMGKERTLGRIKKMILSF